MLWCTPQPRNLTIQHNNNNNNNNHLHFSMRGPDMPLSRLQHILWLAWATVGLGVSCLRPCPDHFSWPLRWLHHKALGFALRAHAPRAVDWSRSRLLLFCSSVLDQVCRSDFVLVVCWLHEFSNYYYVACITCRNLQIEFSFTYNFPSFFRLFWFWFFS